MPMVRVSNGGTGFSSFGGAGKYTNGGTNVINIPSAIKNGILVYTYANYSTGHSASINISFSNGGTATLLYKNLVDDGRSGVYQQNIDTFVYSIENVGAGNITVPNYDVFNAVVMY